MHPMDLQNPLEDLYDKTFLETITFDSWFHTQQHPTTLLRILKLFNNTQAEYLRNNELWAKQHTDGHWVNQAPVEIIDDLMSGSIKINMEDSSPPPFLPFLAKCIIPQGMFVIDIGDLHGNFEASEAILKKMRVRNMLKPSMELDERIKLVFLGDYMDRGPQSLKVLATAALLSLKNPGQVIMLRGNHENIAFNLAPNNYPHNIAFEINAMGTTQETTCAIIEELSKLYEILPVGAFIGYQESVKPTEFFFHVHGCIDIRISCKGFLEYYARNLSQNCGTKFWKLEFENIMTPMNLIDYYADIIPDIQTTISNFSQAWLNPNPAFGFLWNDVSLQTQCPLFAGDRGEDVISLNPYIIKKYFEKNNSDNVKICGIIRAHQHHLPKIRHAVLSANKSKSPVDLINRVDSPKFFDHARYFTKICPEISPACLMISISPNHEADYNEIGDETDYPFAYNFIEASTKTGIVLNPDFSIITLMSAPIMLENKITMSYPPTFLFLGQHNGGNIVRVY